MDRTEELFRIAQLFRPNAGLRTRDPSRVGEKPQSQFLAIALRASANIDGSDSLVSRMEKLSARREFSNDPTAEMSDISDLFHRKLSIIQADFEMLKRLSEGAGAKVGAQHMHHYKLLLQELTKRNVGQVDAFKTALKTHAEHVQERQKRVNRYGQGHEQLKAGSVTSNDASQNYAMFSRPPPAATQPILAARYPGGATMSNNSSTSSYGNQTAAQVDIDELQRSQELRRRAGGPQQPDQFSSGSSGDRPMKEVSPYSNAKPGTKHPPPVGSGYGSSSGAFLGRAIGGLAGGASRMLYGGGGGSGSGTMTEQAQMQMTRNDSRYSSAQKVEASIAQMGQLFSQMATLVMEQSETIARIEDDVEIGLTETQEAHKSMERFYEITKGNRGMILKIFALLIFFIFVFLVWT